MKEQRSVLSSNSIIRFFHEQLTEWPLIERNYEALKKVRCKSLNLGESSVRIQFNPERMLSTAAKTDINSIQERKCFLCNENLPVEQRRISYGSDYKILVNPYPIFPMHFTVPTKDHIDQLIFDRYGDMLDLAVYLSDFVVFYNGPKCGASAPDHMHFQAGNKGSLLIEKDILTQKRAIIVANDVLLCYALPEYSRKVLVVESESKKEMIAMFHKIYAALEIKRGEREPMLNIISWNDNEKWFSCIFPREVHRPQCFYAEGEKHLLFSPASVDLGGVCVFPQLIDFDKVTAEDIKTAFQEICIDDETMKRTIEKIIKN